MTRRFPVLLGLLVLAFSVPSRAEDPPTDPAAENQRIIDTVRNDPILQSMMTGARNPALRKQARDLYAHIDDVLREIDRSSLPPEAKLEQKRQLESGLGEMKTAVLKFREARKIPNPNEAKQARAEAKKLKELGHETLKKIVIPGKGTAASIIFPPTQPPDPRTPNSRMTGGDLISALFAFHAGQSSSAGDAEGAQDANEAALSIDPKNPDALRGTAVAAYNKGDYQTAYDKAREALEINHQDSGAFSILKLSESRGAGELPASASQAAASGGGAAAPAPSAPASPTAGHAGGLVMAGRKDGFAADAARQAENSLRLGDLDTAIALADRALEYNSRSGEAYKVRAAANGRMGRYDLSLKDAVAGLQVSPKSVDLLNTKAYALNRTRNYRAALEAADAALEIDPRSASAHANRAFALRGLGDHAGMLSELRQAATLDARYQASLESALQLPVDSDVFFLFPGEAGAVSGAAKAAAKSSRGGGGLTLVSSLIGGVLLVLGLLSWVGQKSKGPVTASFKPVRLDPPTDRRRLGKVDEKDTI